MMAREQLSTDGFGARWSSIVDGECYTIQAAAIGGNQSWCVV